MTVKQKQWQLWLLGYYDGGIDGQWGLMSKQATKDLQHDYGLHEDGIFGGATMGTSMDVITQLQKALTDGKLAIDGLAGMETSMAIAEWEKHNNMEVSGRAPLPTLHMILGQAAVDEPINENWWDTIKYFSRNEFKCKCGKCCDGFPAEPNRLLIEQAEQVREHFGAPVYVSSGVRCSKHNSNVGGVEGSRHRNGKAMDFRVEGKGASVVLKYVQTLPAIRYAYAIDGSYVHMDVE